MDFKDLGFSTNAIHYASHPDEKTGALSTPIYQTSTFVFKSAAHGGRIFKGEEKGFFYTRINNPNRDIIEKKVAFLEGAEEGIAFSSGMAAISSMFLSLLDKGDHILSSNVLYGATFGLLSKQLPRFGIECSFVDFSDETKITNSLKKNTKIVYLETPSNPTLKVFDLQKISDIIHDYNKDIKVVVDNTFATPYLQRPIEFGVDIVVHSATKYLNGHGDVIAGFVVGSAEDIQNIRKKGLKLLTGASLSPFDSYLIYRGLKTLSIRMERHCSNAQKVAEFLEKHPGVAEVNYPGLKSHPEYELAKKQMKLPGAIIVFEPKGGFDKAVHIIDNTKLWTTAVSLGDCESLIEHPASMTHASFSKEELKEAGISESLIRLSVGLEDAEDLIDDLDQALS